LIKSVFRIPAKIVCYVLHFRFLVHVEQCVCVCGGMWKGLFDKYNLWPSVLPPVLSLMLSL